MRIGKDQLVHELARQGELPMAKMNTVDWWMLEMLSRVSEDPVLTHNDCLRKTIPEIQREAAEEMREQFKRLVRMRFSGWRGLAEVVSAIDALPLPGDEVVDQATQTAEAMGTQQCDPDPEKKNKP